ncbi:MAG: winged helix DNA-binding domain-containing protein [Gemmatimonadaceae bacterium]
MRRLGAVQAQDYAGAKWGVALRTRAIVSDSIVEDALTTGSIVRTHVLRPTWHFVAAADIRWMLALTAPRVKAAIAYHDRWLGLDAAAIRRSNGVITRALDGNHLTRSELSQALSKARVDITAPQRLGAMLMHAELDGLICSGARRGKQFTYALLEERVPPAKKLDRDEALLELATRYFATRSPATVQDFAWWSGLTVKDAKNGIQLAGGRLEQAIIDDRTYWSEASQRARNRSRSPIAHLLPNFDEYFIGFKDRSAIAQRLKPDPRAASVNALSGNVIVVDGQLVGGWKRSFTRDAVVLDLSLSTRLTGAEQRAVERAANVYGAFLKLPVKVLA